MKGFLGLAGVFILIGFISSAQAAIKIEIAEVQNGFAFVTGNGAQNSAQITWEGNPVTTANKNNGGFSFNGVVPADCVGTLSDGASTIPVVVLDCTPVSVGGVILKTGQTACYDTAGTVITCTGTGQDGEFQAGVPIPSPRFTDNGNGTVTDNLTRLTWLKDWICLGSQTWANALTAANTLANGNVACGLSDGSVAGDWRLPNINEFASVLDLSRAGPAFPAGSPLYVAGGGAFWSS